MRSLRIVFALALASLYCASARCQQNLVENSSFRALGQNGVPNGWDPFWSRAAGAGSMSINPVGGHSGAPALQVEHNGTNDWSVSQNRRIPVDAGDIFALSGWVKSEGDGNAQLSVVTRDKYGNTLDWSFGFMEVGGRHNWQFFRRKLVVPDNCANLQFRLIGSGAERIWLESPSIAQAGTLASLTGRAPGADRPLLIGSKYLRIQCDTLTGCLTVIDNRDGREWRQYPVSNDLAVTRSEILDSRTVQLHLLYLPTDGELTATFSAAPDSPQISVVLSGDCMLNDSIAFPHPFAGMTAGSSWLVVPMNEGVLYPLGDPSVPAMRLAAYSGHGICMPWVGQITGTNPSSASGVMTLFNTPDDASLDISRPNNRDLQARPLWDPSRGSLRYTRKITYVFTSEGGYVAQAKLYREYAKRTGLFKTLAQKRAENPNVDLLVGAVNVWEFGMDRLKLCQELKSLGLDRVLWSGDGTSQEIRKINRLGYLSSRYDIYQDVWPPDAPNGLKKAGWPGDLVWLPNGDWMHGWADIRKHHDGTQSVFQGGVISSPCGLKRAKEEIPADLKTHDYKCRFIDTTTASPFREDYNPAHPLSRSEDRHYKMELLEFCSNTEKLVVGTETGIDPSVPYVDYYEGMLSLGPFRLPDAGYDLAGYRKPTPEFLKFMVGPEYRIPLWELVYHDCVVAQWYWGDSSNKAPEVWEKRDLINILYATPPLFMMNTNIWKAHKDRFVSSYRAVTPVARRFGYDEMLSHEFLMPDHTVQSTTWRSGGRVTVNMGEASYKLAGDNYLNAGAWLVQ